MKLSAEAFKNLKPGNQFWTAVRMGPGEIEGPFTIIKFDKKGGPGEWGVTEGEVVIFSDQQGKEYYVYLLDWDSSDFSGLFASLEEAQCFITGDSNENT